VSNFEYRSISGYKYQLTADFVYKTSIHRMFSTEDEWIKLENDGTILIAKGYAWDGCSGPTWDDKYNMKAGLVHDALYQMLEEGLLEINYRGEVDREFRKILKSEGMSSWRAWYYYKAVRMFGARSIKSHEKD